MSLINKHVSFSELKTNDECQYRHFIQYELGHKDGEVIYSEFGSLLHNAIDLSYKDGKRNHWISFGKNFLKWAKKNKTLLEQFCSDKNINIDIYKWIRDGFSLYHLVFNFIENKFPQCEIIESEIEIYEPILENVAQIEGWKFKGYIDLVLKDKDGGYHIIDFKTTEKGWNDYKKSTDQIQYQIILYKKFFSQKCQIPLQNIQTHFLLLKRQPLDSDRIELFTVASPALKVKNATLWMIENTKHISLQNKMKKRSACKYCPWYKTNYCP